MELIKTHLPRISHRTSNYDDDLKADEKGLIFFDDDGNIKAILKEGMIIDLSNLDDEKSLVPQLSPLNYIMDPYFHSADLSISIEERYKEKVNEEPIEIKYRTDSIKNLVIKGVMKEIFDNKGKGFKLAPAKTKLTMGELQEKEAIYKVITINYGPNCKREIQQVSKTENK